MILKIIDSTAQRSLRKIKKRNINLNSRTFTSIFFILVILRNSKSTISPIFINVQSISEWFPPIKVFSTMSNKLFFSKIYKEAISYLSSIFDILNILVTNVQVKFHIEFVIARISTSVSRLFNTLNTIIEALTISGIS